MKVKLYGKTFEIPDGLSDQERKTKIDELAKQAAENITVEMSKELFEEFKKEQAADEAGKAREERMNSGSMTIMDDDAVKNMQAVMKENKKYEARLKAEQEKREKGDK